ncbi:MAG: metallophosphoesterase family protein [Gemmatimonadetes bacterium]|nr:metallophosphoesterase family protein [Gemmatimonadota bacterium]
MRLALISDIHANLPALEAALASVRSEAPDAVYHLGDLVGYGPWPDEVVALLRAEGIAGVSGNYDSTVALDAEHCGCRYEDPLQERLSHASFEWTKQRVSAATRWLLGALPFRIDLRPAGGHASGPRLVFVHGTPTLNTLYWTEDRPDSFFRKMAGHAGLKDGDLIAYGHTHLPYVRRVDDVTYVNCGSVGKPKDGDPRGSYAIVEHQPHAWSVRIVRFDYDVARAAQAVRDQGLPSELADLLVSGGAVVGPDS